MRIRKVVKTSYFIEKDGQEFEVPCEPIEGTEIFHIKEDSAVVGYLSHDKYVENPRELGEPLGTIAYWHLRYTFGEEQIKSHPNTWLRELADLSDASMEEVWKAVNEQYIFLPLSLLDHSGLHMWVGKGAHYSDPGAISRCLTSTHLCVEMLS